MRLSKISIIGIIALLLFSPLAVAQSWPNPGHPAGQVGGGTFNSSYGNFLFPSGVNVTADSTTFHVDATNDKVGIGTTTPATKFTVVGNLNATGIVLATNCNDGQILKWTSGVGSCGTDSGLGTESDTLATVTSRGNTTTQPVTIDSDSNELTNIANTLYVNGTTDSVGIGTSTPDQLLKVAGNANITGTLYTGGDIRFPNYGAPWTAGMLSRNGNDLQWYDTAARTIVNSGNIGSYETDPQVALTAANDVCYGTGSAVECANANLYWDNTSSKLSVQATSSPQAKLSVGGAGSISNAAIYGQGGDSHGYIGVSPASNADVGVLGNSSGSGGLYSFGVLGRANVNSGNPYNMGVVGTLDTSTFYYQGNYSVYGRYDSSNYGYLGSSNTGVYGLGTSYGVFASGGSTGVYGTGTTVGVNGTGGTYGVYGTGSSWAGFFNGNVNISGTGKLFAHKDSANGAAVTGYEYPGYAYGALGYFDGTNSIGVYGNASTSGNIGVYGYGGTYPATFTGDGSSLVFIGESSVCIDTDTTSNCASTEGDLSVYNGSACVGSAGCTIPAGEGNLAIDNNLSLLSPPLLSLTANVYWNSTNFVLFRTSSSRRYKTDIRDYNFDYEDIGKLRPVRFRLNNLTGAPGMEDFGLIAEEVADVFPELVIYNGKGQPEDVQYAKLGVILVNAFREQDKLIKEQEITIEQLKLDSTRQQEEIEGLKKAIGEIIGDMR